MSLSSNKCVILGLGLSGRSAARFLLQQGAQVIGLDCNHAQLHAHPDIQSLKKMGLQIFSDDTSYAMQEDMLLILSPGIFSNHPLVKKAKEMHVEVIGEIELGCRHVSNPVWGITGTNGKTTVTLLISHVLNQTGSSAKALGNVGKPFTQEISFGLSPKDKIILELSSYQLETLQQKILQGALLLNISPDHLDRYSSMHEYAKTKCHIGNCLKYGSPFIVEHQTWLDYKPFLENFSVQTYGYTTESTVYTDLKNVYRNGQKEFELPASLAGRKGHEIENLMGAYALCAYQGVSGLQFVRAFGTFRKPPHRLELVMEANGVSYYDDSKGTNVAAVVQAVQSLKGSIILIAGGVDKGSSYQPWISQFEGKVRKILAIGEAASKIYAELNEQISTEIVKNLEEAVIKASMLAKKGESILLSPGCASYDMFRDYAHRGEVFQQVVRELVNKGTVHV